MEQSANITGNVGIALVLATIAGLFTGLGSAIAYLIREPKRVYLAFALGLSTGVMIYVSFMELLPDAIKAAGERLGLTAFFVGIAFIGLIDMLIPEAENPHSCTVPENSAAKQVNAPLMKMGLFTALAIGIHNFPEGLATFTSALINVKIGLFVAAAIGIHNILEGIVVSMPIFYATGNRNKAFFYSFLSGLAEPVGAIIGALILLPFLSVNLSAFLSGFAAGIMVYVSMDELLPMAHRYGQSHIVIAGIVSGMLIMAISLLLL